jgi:hypothetical protein
MAEEIVAQPATETQPLSIAAQMAQSGRLNDTTNVTIPSINITEKKEEPKPQEANNAASANEPSNAVQEISTTPSPTPEPTPTPTPQAAAEPAKVQTWQEVLKNQQPDTVLKELGYDEKVVSISKAISESPQMAALFDQWINKGDLTPYLKAVTTDYGKMSPEDLMRHQIMEQYPQASEDTLNALYKRRVVQAYNLDSDDENEVKEGRLLLEADAYEVRNTLSGKQQQFLTPKPPEPKAAEPVVDTAAIQRQKSYEDFSNNIKDSSFTKDLINAKQLSVGDGDDKFNYPLEKPQEIVDLLLNEAAWSSKLFNKELQPDGSEKVTPNVQKQLLVGAILNDTDGFFRKMAAHFKTLGSKEVIAPIDNASPANNGSASAPMSNPASIAEYMARQGKLT